MPPVDRKNPIRAKSSESSYSLMEFQREFPDDDACLEWLWRNRFSEDGKHTDCPKCKREHVLFKKYATKQRRQTWTCTQCGHHVQPTAGTIFEGSSTSLHLWFFALHLMTSTRCGVAAKQLERELGVTYKTAWRMFNLIRNELMADDGRPLTGEVEVDETSVGGKPRTPMNRSEAAYWRAHARPTVMAAVERGGRVKATVVPSRYGPHVKRQVIEWVNPEAIIYTDDWKPYSGLDEHFAAHSRINHSAGLYVVGDTHINAIEGFFGNLKTGIRGNYKKVSRRWLQGYLNEFVWRYNHRNSRRAMFEALLLRTARS
jgi:transposase-like protein